MEYTLNPLVIRYESLGHQIYALIHAIDDFDGQPARDYIKFDAAEKEHWEFVAKRLLEFLHEYTGPRRKWRNELDERQNHHIDFSVMYANQFHHGADGHNSMMLIAKLAGLLDGKP